MRYITLIALALVTTAVVGASLVGLSESNLWWVRMTDFPRLHYALILAIVIAVALFVDLPGRWSRFLLVGIAFGAGAFNVTKLYPYMTFARETAEQCAAEDRLRVMSMNVLLENDDYDAAIAAVRAADPDVLIALEVDERWSEALSRLSDILPTKVSEITGSYYGMELRSRVPLEDTETVYALKQDTPSILTTAVLPSENKMRLIAFHPRPPHPGQSSAGRDAQLMWAALLARDATLPVVIAGDFNAVPWERGVMRMQRIGRFLDPRAGRGLFISFDAKSRWMKWPLDQVFYQPDLSLLDYEIGQDTGSDHYPVIATLCHRPAGAEPPEVAEGDIAEAREDIAEAEADR